MQKDLKDILSEAKLDFNAYGKLPISEDVIVMADNGKNRSFINQWEKLNYLRKNLFIVDTYIQKNKGETVIEYVNTLPNSLSPEVLKKIGSHNNDTGGISAYFLDLQNFYDEQEELYDKMESEANLPVDLKKAIPELRENRLEKRQNRRKVRKIMIKDLKADGKGYLNVVLEQEEPESEEVFHADGNGTQQQKTSESKKDDLTSDQKEEIKKSTNNIGKTIVWVAGIGIAIATVYSLTKKEES